MTIKASAYRGSVHDFNLAVAIKGDETSLNARLGVPAWKKGQEGVPAWKKGQVIRINKDNFNGWCKGCQIEILLDVTDEGYYHVMAQTTDATPLLQNNV